jgi:hypothetical protein
MMDMELIIALMTFSIGVVLIGIAVRRRRTGRGLSANLSDIFVLFQALSLWS